MTTLQKLSSLPPSPRRWNGIYGARQASQLRSGSNTPATASTFAEQIQQLTASSTMPMRHSASGDDNERLNRNTLNSQIRGEVRTRKGQHCARRWRDHVGQGV
jgi:hypothetical protein